MQNHYRHDDAADQRLGIELIGEYQPVRKGGARTRIGPES
jgi:hypothetical protein